MQPFVVIGGVAAGMSAASKARRLRPDWPIIVYEQGSHVSYGACGLPYYLSGVIPDYRKMIIRDPEYFLKKMQIQVHVRHRVLAIDTENKKVLVKNLDTGETFCQRYETLLYAAGASPVLPPVPGVALPGVFPLRTLEDGLALHSRLQDPVVRRIVVIGGGYVGLEVIENLRLLGKEVQLIELEERLLLHFAPDFSAIIRDELEKNQVEMHFGESLAALRGNGHLQTVVTEKGEYPCDLAVLAVGVRPNSDLAKAAGIALGYKNAVAVDRRMRTNMPDILAAGDCAETYHRLWRKNVYLPLGTTANRQGRLAGENACGGQAEFTGVLGTSVAKIFSLAAAKTGFTEQEAAQAGLAAASSIVETIDHAIYYPGARRLHLKLVYCPRSAVLLGGQIVGSEGVAHRIDVLATAIAARMTLQELGEVDMSYAPPYKGVWEAVVVAANVAQSAWEKAKG
ncbi:MAG: Coenzyme A disulfide reductase [Syntrophomonadaceae bacterium]|nr:Coenzyme A disulfide reductase [Bacillota bacterium]